MPVPKKSTKKKAGDKRGSNAKSLANLKPGFTDSMREKAVEARRESGLFTTAIRKKLNEVSEVVVEGYDVLTGKPMKIRVPQPNLDVIVTRIMSEAANGNMKAAELLVDRIDGKAAQPIEIETPEGHLPAVIVLSDGREIQVQ